jgi:hypothetical protein
MSVGVMEDYKLRDFGRIIVVLEPVPRKSEDVIIILLSLILGRGHFDPVKDRTDDFLGEEVDTVTVGYGSDGWGLRTTYTMQSG